MKIFLAILLLIPSLSFAETHVENDTSLDCMKIPHVQIGDYPFVNRHYWWIKIYGGENYLVDVFRIQMTARGPELNKLDGSYTTTDLKINFGLPALSSRNNFTLDRVSLELITHGNIGSTHSCMIIDDAFTEAKRIHAILLAQYIEDQAKLKSERKL